MTFIAFGLYSVAVIVVAYLIEALLSMWVNHPAIIDKLVWFLAILIILMKLANVMGFSDIQLPHL